jgi:hypothetical protein
MISALRRAWDAFRGSGHAAVTVPPMDGALRPNQILEQAPRLAALKGADNLVGNGARTLFSSDSTVYELDTETGGTREVVAAGAPVSALALSADGSLAIATEDGRIVIKGGRHNDRTVTGAGGSAFHCPTALLFLSPDELVIAQGSARRRTGEWKFDLMEGGASGSVTVTDIGKGSATRLADGLAWPAGLAIAPDGSIAVSESWRHRIVLVGRNGGTPRSAFEDLPGYPGRLSPASDGGYWLSVFAPRGQLIEFVLREKDFRNRMMSEVDPDYWVAPSLIASHTFLEPLQGGAQIHLGMLKPWAPTRSYGLVVRLNQRFQPVQSFHSRADGKRHGITSCVEVGGRVLATSRSAGDIAALPLGQPQTVAAMEEA